MISDTYKILETTSTLEVLWTSPGLLAASRPLAVLIVLGGIAWGTRPWVTSGPPEGRGRRRRWALLTGGGMAILGLLGLVISRPPETLVRWTFDPEGLRMTSLTGEASARWADLAGARFDERERGAEDASLVLTRRDGREMYVVLRWLVPDHQRKLLTWVAARSPVAIPPQKSSDR